MITLLAGLSPTAALGVFTVGILLIYVELNRPGTVIHGALGLLLTLLACARLCAAHLQLAALVLLATAVGLLLLELLSSSHMAIAVAATLVLVLGFHELLVPPVGWAVCILCGGVLGGVTAMLTRVARRAKVNKVSR